jgi:hypothetical protein
MRSTVARCALFFLTLSLLARGAETAPLVPMPAEWRLTLTFDESAATLPQDDIRTAVETALGVPVELEPSAAHPTLCVSVAPDGSLLLVYQRSDATLERRLPHPTRADQIPVLVGLAATNLVWDQMGALVPRTETPRELEYAPLPAGTPDPNPPGRSPQPAPPTPAPLSKSRKAPPHFEHWLGLHVGVDLVPLSANAACDRFAADEGFVCLLPDGSTYTGVPSISAAGKLEGGVVAATVPILLSYEYILGSFGLGGRFGYAFNGGPHVANRPAFFPVRAELRGKFWPLGPTASSLVLRPYLHLGVGLAQVDAVVHDVSIVDCSIEPRLINDCRTASSAIEARVNGGELRNVTVLKSFGKASFSAGAGATLAIADGHAMVLDLSFTAFLPSTGLSITPSIGYEIGL